MSEQIECPDCDGFGTVQQVRMLASLNREILRVYECPTCDGRGNMFAQTACGWAFDCGMREAERDALKSEQRDDGSWWFLESEVHRQIDLAVAAERERCLKWVRWTGRVAPTRTRAVVSATLGIESGAPAPREG